MFLFFFLLRKSSSFRKKFHHLHHANTYLHIEDSRMRQAYSRGNKELSGKERPKYSKKTETEEENSLKNPLSILIGLPTIPYSLIKKKTKVSITLSTIEYILLNISFCPSLKDIHEQRPQSKIGLRYVISGRTFSISLKSKI